MLDSTVGMDLKHFLYFAACFAIILLLNGVDDPLRDLEYCEISVTYTRESIELEPAMGNLYYIQD
jgi:hypothetical protein